MRCGPRCVLRVSPKVFSFVCFLGRGMTMLPLWPSALTHPFDPLLTSASIRIRTPVVAVLRARSQPHTHSSLTTHYALPDATLWASSSALPCLPPAPTDDELYTVSDLYGLLLSPALSLDEFNGVLESLRRAHCHATPEAITWYSTDSCEVR